MGGKQALFKYFLDWVVTLYSPLTGNMSRENNEDVSTGRSIESDFDLEVGFLAMVGVKVETDVHFGVSDSNNASCLLHDKANPC